MVKGERREPDTPREAGDRLKSTDAAIAKLRRWGHDPGAETPDILGPVVGSFRRGVGGRRDDH